MIVFSVQWVILRVQIIIKRCHHLTVKHSNTIKLYQIIYAWHFGYCLSLMQHMFNHALQICLTIVKAQCILLYCNASYCTESESTLRTVATKICVVRLKS